MVKTKLPILSIIGPTAIGKTELAFIFEKKYPVEIISVDSAMIYREMDIGTDKPNSKILSKIKHHLIDIRDPNENYNVGDFSLRAPRERISLYIYGCLPNRSSHRRRVVTFFME